MKKYGSTDLLTMLYNKLRSLECLYGDIDVIEFKVSIGLIGHINITYDKHYIIISPIEYDGSTDYIIDDSDGCESEHDDYCNNLNDICVCVLSIVKKWFN